MTPPAAYVAGLAEHAGLPERVATLVATLGQAVREGHLATITSVVEDLTWRPATPLRNLLAANLPVAVG